MELHPDRNYGNVEETTKLFAEVQSAYAVLSDPQERAWYDSHRDTILSDGNRDFGEHFEHNVRITTAEDILRLFARFNGRMDFSDSPSSFYGVLRDTFDNLASEEKTACEWEDVDPIMYPSFGRANDSYEDVVRPFYADWNGFATRKTFSWKDAYRQAEAPDRRVRRMMEQENKRLRDEGIRTFNDAVRSLVAFVKKRDPRFVQNAQSEEDRQRTLRDAATAQAARSRAANQARLNEHVVLEWMKSREPDEEVNSDEEEEPEQRFECVVCNKIFKSEKQYDMHEKSKKHVKAFQLLGRKMRIEDKMLRMDKNHSSGVSSPATAGSLISSTHNDATKIKVGESNCRDPSSLDVDASLDTLAEDREASLIDHVKEPMLEPAIFSKLTSNESLLSSSSGDERAEKPNSEKLILIQGTAEVHIPQSNLPHAKVGKLSQVFDAGSIALESDSSPQPTSGKAKEKRAEKAAQKAAASARSEPEVSKEMRVRRSQVILQ